MTTPLDWRSHLTEDEARCMEVLDAEIETYRMLAADYTQQRELIRRRVTRRVKARIKREKK